METRNGLVNFGLFVVLFAFSFVFCLDALAIPNAFYGALAAFGFVVCIVGSLFTGMMSRREGAALSVWYFAYAIVVSIVTVWYFTRCGAAFKFW